MEDYVKVYVDKTYDEEIPTETPEKEDIWRHYIVTKIGYLMGIDIDILRGEGFEQDTLSKMERDIPSRIIRNLNIIRTAIFRYNDELYREMTYDFKNIRHFPDKIPHNILDQLEEDGIPLEKTNYKLNSYSIDINDHMKNRINNCKKMFPDWINWDYIKKLLVIQNASTEAGIIYASIGYRNAIDKYPYEMYINWPSRDVGGILNNDCRFVKQLYNDNGRDFEDISKLRKATDSTKMMIEDFVKRSPTNIMLVDCENSDVYKLTAVLQRLKKEELDSHITEIILFDDFHTTNAWQILNDYTDIDITYKQVDRVKEDKSLVDPALMLAASKYYYKSNVDSFIIAASDSDYWELIRELDGANFLIMAEYEKCGPDIRAKMEVNNVPYCYIDDFNTGDIQDIKSKILYKELNTELKEININLLNIIEYAIEKTRMTLTEDEKEAYIKKFLKNFRYEIGGDGNVRFIV